MRNLNLRTRLLNFPVHALALTSRGRSPGMPPTRRRGDSPRTQLGDSGRGQKGYSFSIRGKACYACGEPARLLPSTPEAVFPGSGKAPTSVLLDTSFPHRPPRHLTGPQVEVFGLNTKFIRAQKCHVVPSAMWSVLCRRCNKSTKNFPSYIPHRPFGLFGPRAQWLFFLDPLGSPPVHSRSESEQARQFPSNLRAV